MRQMTCVAGAAMAAMMSVGTSAMAETIEDFYRGKTVNLIVSSGVGGGDDLVVRTLVRFMPNHIPGQPSLVVRHMPGAGHVLATNYLYNQAPRDGTTIGTIGNSVPLHQVLDGKGVRYDTAQFKWLGSTGISNLTTVVRREANIHSIEDVLTREVTAGSTGTGSGTMLYPTVMNNVLGTKFKIITGYQRAGEIDLAMERGEVDARGGFSFGSLSKEHPDWLAEKKVVFLVQVGGQREVKLPDVPLMHELARNNEQREILELLSSAVALGRPFLTTPEVPDVRYRALRQAFDATLKDPEFVAESERLAFDLIPLDGDQLSAIVRATVNASPEVIAKAKLAMETPDSVK